MKAPLRDVHEIVVDGNKMTYRAAYYSTKNPDGPVAVLDVFIKKSKSGIATPKVVLDRIRLRLKRIKEIENE